MDNGSWYNKTICSQLNGPNFEYYFKKGQKYRYELVCDFDAYNKQHIPMPEYASSGDGIPLSIFSYKETRISLGRTINFIDNWIQ